MRPPVFNQVIALCECPIANFAPVRFLTGMNAVVPLKVIFTRESETINLITLQCL